MTPTPDELVEIGARALCKLHGIDPDELRAGLTADSPPIMEWEWYAPDARAVLDAVLPRVREEKMPGVMMLGREPVPTVEVDIEAAAIRARKG